MYESARRTRELIIATEVRKLELRQARARAARVAGEASALAGSGPARRSRV